ERGRSRRRSYRRRSCPGSETENGPPTPRARGARRTRPPAARGSCDSPAVDGEAAGRTACGSRAAAAARCAAAALPVRMRIEARTECGDLRTQLVELTARYE